MKTPDQQDKEALGCFAVVIIVAAVMAFLAFPGCTVIRINTPPDTKVNTKCVIGCKNTTVEDGGVVEESKPKKKGKDD